MPNTTYTFDASHVQIQDSATLAILAEIYNTLAATPIKKFSSKAIGIQKVTDVLVQVVNENITDTQLLADKFTGKEHLFPHMVVTPPTSTTTKTPGRISKMHEHTVTILNSDFISRPNSMRQKMLQFIVDNENATVKQIMDKWYDIHGKNATPAIARKDFLIPIDANMFMVAVQKGIVAPFTARQENMLNPTPEAA